MTNFETLMTVKDTRSYSVYTAIAQYKNGQRAEIDIYLYRTLICTINLISYSFELTNGGWSSCMTLKALKEWKAYLQSNGYCLTALHWTGISPNSFNLAVRLPAKVHLGGYVMEENNYLLCSHIGKSNVQLKSIPEDKFYIASNIMLHLDKQPLCCYMRGRNEKQIAEFVSEHNGVKFTLHFSLSEPPELCGLWEYKEILYLFHFRAQAIYYRSDFTACNVTYIADKMYRTDDATTITLIKMLDISGSAFQVYKNMLNKFKCLV